MNKTVIMPLWTAPMFPGTSGRDHLGLGSVSSFQILARLSPGVNVLTIHPRYYSFYTFLLYDFWQRDRPRSVTEWVRYFRPRALAYSIACHLSQPSNPNPIGSIMGSRKVAPLVEGGQAEFDMSFDFIKSRQGGYGLYYRNAMITLGLIVPGGAGLPTPMDTPTKLGEKIAKSFGETIQATTYFRSYFDEDQVTVPRSVLEEYGRVVSLERLPNAPEQPLLLDVFLHGDANVAGFAEARRNTFRFLLDIADQTNGIPLDEDSFRQLIYFGSAPNGATYHERPHIKTVCRQWRMYQMREYYSFAFNAMWDYLCTWGIYHNGDVIPLRIRDFWAHLETEISFDRLTSILNLPSSGLTIDSDIQRLFDWLCEIVDSDVENFDNACTLNSPIHEHMLHRLAYAHRGDATVMAGGMLVMLALVFLRIGEIDSLDQVELEIAAMGDDGRLAMIGFIYGLKRQIASGYLPIRDVLRWLYSSYIIDQHIAVATDKLPDNTFRFRREGGRLQFFNLPNSLIFMSSRFEALSTTVHELGLCGDWRTSDHGLTPQGRQLLLEGNLS
ncbi:MAG: hypothetical protein R3A44_28065 [Caldilineaceae bacterium]